MTYPEFRDTSCVCIECNVWGFVHMNEHRGNHPGVCWRECYYCQGTGKSASAQEEEECDA